MNDTEFRKDVLSILQDICYAVQEVHDEAYAATEGGPDWMRGSSPISLTSLKSAEEQIDKLNKIMECKHTNVKTSGHRQAKCLDCGSDLEISIAGEM